MTAIGGRSRAILVTLVMLMLVPRAALAAWPSDPTINVPICTAANDQTAPRLVSDGSGGVIITWQDNRPASNSDIYAQRVSASGVVMWTPGGVVLCNAPGDQMTPTIVPDGVGGAIVTWEDFRDLVLGSSIYAQRVDASGVVQWAPNGVALSNNLNSRYNPTSISDGAGGAIVAWQSASTTPTYDVHVQRVTSAGAIATGWPADGVVPSTTVIDRLNAALVPDGAGGAIVAWQTLSPISTNDIYAQRLNASGAPQWTATGVVVSATTNAQYAPLAVTDGVGGAVVLWQDTRNSTYDLYGQRLNGSGAPQWTPNGVALCPGVHGEVLPAMVSDDANGAIVAWQDTRNGTADVYTQRLGSTGTPLWTAGGVALCLAAGNQQYVAIASDKAGGAIVAWPDGRPTGPGVYARRVNALGAPQWATDGVAISTASSYQATPAFVADGAGGAMAAWQDGRNLAGWDVYAQNVSGAGVLGGTVLSVPAMAALSGLQVRCAGRNPSPGGLTLSFSLLDDSPATLEVFDVGGRRVESREVGALGAGTHVASFASARALPAGVYAVRLSQGARQAFARAVVVR